jgi:GTPase SAR1 family protein
MQPVNPDLQLAFEFVQFTNRNIFLTGKAGTGKTTFLHNLKKKSPKRMIVVAPTGVAAINAGGVTIHSFFQLPFHPHIPTQYIGEVNPGSSSDTSMFKLSRDKIRIIKGLDLLVIDEISMVRADLLDAVDKVLRRYKDKTAAFGGVQLLMIGDIQQLAPVAKQEEWEVLEQYYDTPFFFGSLALRNTDYVTIELKHIYRQQDQHFIELLNRVRDNQLDSVSLAALNKRHDPKFRTDENSGYITLTTHNAQAQSINDTRLEQLP